MSTSEVVKSLDASKKIGMLTVQIDGEDLFSVDIVSRKDGGKEANCVVITGAPPHTKERKVSAEIARKQFMRLGADVAPLNEFLEQEGWDV